MILLLALLGCSECESPRVVDEDGRMDADGFAQLEEGVSEWLGWVGTERACVDQVEVVAGETAYWSVTRSVSISAEAPWPRSEAWTPLCMALDEREDLSEAGAAVLDGEPFPSRCGCGPPDIEWRDQVIAACGEDPLSPMEDWLAETVYPGLPDGSDAGDLEVLAGTPLIVTVAGSLSGYEAAGEGLYLLLSERVDDVLTQRVARVDLTSGEPTEVLALSDVESGELYGGPDAVVYAERLDEGARLHVIDATSLAVTTVDAAIERVPARGVVSGGRLYGDEGYGRTTPLTVVDLVTGDLTEVELPPVAAGRERLVNGLLPTADGVLAQLLDTTVVADGDVVSITIHEKAWWTWDGVAWTERAAGWSMDEAGLVDDHVAVGTLWDGAGEVLAAIDVETGAVSVSDDVCLADERPAFVAGGAAWWLETGEGTLALTPWSLDSLGF